MERWGSLAWSECASRQHPRPHMTIAWITMHIRKLIVLHLFSINQCHNLYMLMFYSFFLISPHWLMTV